MAIKKKTDVCINTEPSFTEQLIRDIDSVTDKVKGIILQNISHNTNLLGLLEDKDKTLFNIMDLTKKINYEQNTQEYLLNMIGQSVRAFYLIHIIDSMTKE
jgi:hypothetical protein